MNVTVDADVLMSTLPVELCKAQSKRMPLAEKLLRLLKITCRIEKLAGLTQASTVNGNAAISSVLGSETLSSTPSKERALPFLPGIHTGPLVRVPDMPLPETSAVVRPVPSSNAKAAARVLVVALVTLE